MTTSMDHSLPLVGIFELIRQLDATLTQDERQAQRLASRWLILYLTSKGWSYESLVEHTGLSLEALKLLAYGVANYDLGTDQQWSTLATLLEDEAHNEDFIMSIILVALGLYQPEDADLVTHIATDLEAYRDGPETTERQSVGVQVQVLLDAENIMHNLHPQHFPAPDQPVPRVRILVTEDTEQCRLHIFNYLINTSRPFGPWYGAKVYQEDLRATLEVLHEIRPITIEDETLYITQHIESNQTSPTEWATTIAETKHVVPDLVQQIFDAPDRATLFQLIEAAALNVEQQEKILYSLRNRVGVGSSDAYDERVWRVVLACAYTAPLPLAIAMHIYGRRCLLRGDYKGSIEPLRVAAEAYRWAGDEDGEGRVKAQLANALYSDGQYDEALPLARTAYQIFARAGLEVGVSKSLITIGAIYADIHRSQEAIDSYRAAIAVFNPEDTSNVALETITGALIDIAWVCHEQLEQLEEAQEALAQADPLLERLRQQPGTNYWRQHFTFYLQHARIALRLGHHATARRYLGQAEAWLSKDTISDQFHIDLWRGYQALLLGDTRSASHLLQKAAQQSESRESMKCKADASLFAALLPDLPLEIALRLLEDAERIYRSLDMTLAPALIATEKARLIYRAGDIAHARIFLSQARQMCEAHNLPRRILEVDLIRATYDPDITIDELRHLAARFAATPDYISQASIWTILGEQLEHAGQLSPAHHAYEQAIAATIAVRGVVRSSVHVAQMLLAHRWSYERAFALTARHDPIRAHALSEQARAQALLNEVVNDRLLDAQEENDQPLTRLRELRLRLDMAAARASLLSTNTVQVSTRSATEEVYDELREAQLAFMQALQDAEVQRAGTRDWALGQVEDANAVQAALNDTTAVISYFRVRRLDSRRSDLWVVIIAAQGTPLVRRVARHEDLDPFLKMWEEQRERAFDPHTGQPQSVAEGLLELLFTTFFGSIWADLASYQRLIIIPDETLPLVPLHAARLDTGAYVLMSHIVSYAPSASFLLYCLRREAARDSASGALLCGWEGSGKRKLRYVQKELQALEGPLKTTSRHGMLSASEVFTAMRDVRFIHLSCHGSFPENAHPRFAHLQLGRDNLFAYDLYAQQLRADLLALSACDTGKFGAGLQGLFSAGLVAGASTVLASMWPADDKSTTTIMEQFYTALLTHHESRAAALRTAQLHCIESQADHPGLWAPFFIVGVPGPLRLESAGSASAISKV